MENHLQPITDDDICYYLLYQIGYICNMSVYNLPKPYHDNVGDLRDKYKNAAEQNSFEDGLKAKLENMLKEQDPSPGTFDEADLPSRHFKKIQSHHETRDTLKALLDIIGKSTQFDKVKLNIATPKGKTVNEVLQDIVTRTYVTISPLDDGIPGSATPFSFSGTNKQIRRKKRKSIDQLELLENEVLSKIREMHHWWGNSILGFTYDDIKEYARRRDRNNIPSVYQPGPTGSSTSPRKRNTSRRHRHTQAD